MMTIEEIVRRRCQIKVQFESGGKTKFPAALFQPMTPISHFQSVPWSHSFQNMYNNHICKMYLDVEKLVFTVFHGNCVDFIAKSSFFYVYTFCLYECYIYSESYGTKEHSGNQILMLWVEIKLPGIFSELRTQTGP